MVVPRGQEMLSTQCLPHFNGTGPVDLDNLTLAERWLCRRRADSASAACRRRDPSCVHCVVSPEALSLRRNLGARAFLIVEWTLLESTV